MDREGREEGFDGEEEEERTVSTGAKDAGRDKGLCPPPQLPTLHPL